MVSVSWLRLESAGRRRKRWFRVAICGMPLMMGDEVLFRSMGKLGCAGRQRTRRSVPLFRSLDERQREHMCERRHMTPHPRSVDVVFTYGSPHR